MIYVWINYNKHGFGEGSEIMTGLVGNPGNGTKGANFDSWRLTVHSFRSCSIYYCWLFHYSNRLPTWMELDKKKEFEAAPSLSYGRYYYWDYCGFDVPTHSSGKYVSRCWLLFVFHTSLGCPDFVLGFAKPSFYFYLLCVLGMGVNFMENLPSNWED